MTALPKEAEAEWYRVTDWKLECQCQWCGVPLQVGDQALEAYGGLYCSATCATTHNQQ